MTAPAVRTALYRLYDESDTLLYVGISINPPIRFREHGRRDWWQNVVRSTLEWWPDQQSAEAAEITAIRTEHPLHNRRHLIPHDNCAESFVKIAELRDQLDDAESAVQDIRRELLAEIVRVSRGAGPGIAGEVAKHARWSAAHINAIRKGIVRPCRPADRAYVAAIRDGEVT